MIRTVDYNQRKKAILAATINKYIKDAAPISSEDIAENFGLSSATIRNIFKDLEEEKYLTHPYTSGGRVPTDKGYRYYVDCLIFETAASHSDEELLNEEKERIDREYHREIRKLEDVLENTTDLLSGVTHCASIVSFSDEQVILFYKGLSFIIEQPEFQNSSQLRHIIKIIEDKQRLFSIVNRNFSDKVKVYIGEELECPEMEYCSLAVSRYSAKKKPSGRIAVLGPTRMNYTHIISALGYISDILSDTLD